MNKLLALPILAALAVCGCAADVDSTAKNPDVKVDVDRAPDLDPRTDHDIDIKAPNVDVDVHRTPGQLPDVDVNVKNP